MKTKFKEWWNRPITAVDRLFGALIGAFGGFWLLLPGRLFLGPTPVSFSKLGIWAAAGVVAGLVAGIMYPRATSIVLFPFSA